MKCRCGGETVASRVKVTHRGKQYKPVSYKCKECDKEFYLSRIYIPVKGRSLRGKASD